MSDVEREESLSRRDALCGEIRGMAEGIERLFRLAMEGLGCFRAVDLRQVIDKIKAVDTEADRLIVSFTALAEGRSDSEASKARSSIRAVDELKLIGGCINDFCESAVVRIKEGLLFSDEAFKEIEELHASVASVLRDAVQAIVEGSCSLLPGIEDKGRTVEAMIKKFSAEHERRLMSGACDIKSSAIFLDILDSLGGIAGHAVALSRTPASQ